MKSDTSSLIHNLETIYREIPLEGDLQLATMIKLFRNDIPQHIKAHRELEALKRGKSIAGASKEANRIPLRIREPRHTTMPVWDIPD